MKESTIPTQNLSKVMESTIRTEKSNDGQEEMGMIAGKGQKQAKRNYIIRKQRKIGKEIFHINLGRNGWHLARKVLETGPTRYKNLIKQVQIEWDSNHQIEWVDESKIGNSVSKEGRGKRHRRTVQEARVADKKRLQEDHRISQKNSKRTRMKLAFEATQYADEITKGLTRHPLTGTMDWYLAAKEIIRVGEESNDPTLAHHFIRGTFAPISPGFISGILKTDMRIVSNNPQSL
jgi:hypothetical protein